MFAAMLFAAAHPQPHPHPADDRGITLQTLIVTSVLVFLAAAVGLLSAALIDNASDDLEATTAEIAPRCTSVEIYDPQVAAYNQKGINIAFSPPPGSDFSASDPTFAAFEGSAIGCIPVCVWKDRGGMGRNRILEPGEVEFARDLSRRSDLPIFIMMQLTGGAKEVNYLLGSGSSREDITYFHTATGRDKARVHDDGNLNDLMQSNGTVHALIARVAVAPNQQECHAYDAAGNVLNG